MEYALFCFNIIIQTFDLLYCMYFSAKITDLTASINSIPMLMNSNYKKYKDILEIILGCLDLDIALQQAKPPVPAVNSPENVQNAHARWMMSNCLCLKVMQRTIPESFRGPVSDST
jgi:hypothetical protein